MKTGNTLEERPVPAVSGTPHRLTSFSACLLLAGALTVAWAFTDPRFRDAEHAVRGLICLPLSVGVALFVIAATISGRCRRFGLWLALALAGQAVSLQGINAGQHIHYQHYTLSLSWWMLLTGLQAVAVGLGLRAYYRAIALWLGSSFRRWSLVCALALFILSSAALSRDPRMYAAEVLLAAAIQLIHLGALLLAIAALPEDVWPAAGRWLRRVLGSEEDSVCLRREKFVWLAALWVTGLAAVLCYFSYERHPHLADEVTYLYHGRYLAEGKLTMPAPPVPEAFAMYLMDVDKTTGHWFATPPPAWPAILAVGVWLHVPWLVNPLLAGVNIILAYLLLAGLFTRWHARLGVLLLCASPWFLFMSMNFMTHTFTLTCALVALLAVHRSRTGGAAWALLSGAALGATALIRPLDGLVLALLVGLWAIGLGGKRLRLSALAALALGTALTGSLTLAYNFELTGSPAKFPINAYVDKMFGPGVNDLGFGPNRGLNFGGLEGFPGHGLPDVLINAELNVSSLNVELFGWSAGSLVLILLLVFSGHLRRLDWAMIGCIAVVVFAFSFYWYSGGPDFGARYWYLALFPLVALSTSGVKFLAHTADARHNGARVTTAVLLLCGFAVVNYIPWRAVDKYYHYLGMRPDIGQLAAQNDFSNSLVLVRGPLLPDYSSAWIFNPLRFDTREPVYASLEKTDPKQVVASFPGRTIWLVDGPTITGSGYRVVGKMSAEQFHASN